MKPTRRIFPATRRRLPALLALGLLLALPACMSFTHQVHNGPLGTVEVSKSQYFCLFGLVRLNRVDSKAMAAPQQSYSITTEFTFGDLLVSALLSPLTVVRQTVTVKK